MVLLMKATARKHAMLHCTHVTTHIGSPEPGAPTSMSITGGGVGGPARGRETAKLGCTELPAP